MQTLWGEFRGAVLVKLQTAATSGATICRVAHRSVPLSVLALGSSREEITEVQAVGSMAQLADSTHVYSS